MIAKYIQIIILIRCLSMQLCAYLCLASFRQTMIGIPTSMPFKLCAKRFRTRFLLVFSRVLHPSSGFVPVPVCQCRNSLHFCGVHSRNCLLIRRFVRVVLKFVCLDSGAHHRAAFGRSCEAGVQACRYQYRASNAKSLLVLQPS